MAVSSAVAVSLSTGDSGALVAGPGVLTDIIACEMSTAAPAALALVHGNGASLAYVALVANGMFSWHGELGLPDGLSVECQAGEVAVTIGYR